MLKISTDNIILNMNTQKKIGKLWSERKKLTTALNFKEKDSEEYKCLYFNNNL